MSFSSKTASSRMMLRFARHETEVGPEGKISIFSPNVPKLEGDGTLLTMKSEE